MQSRRTIPARLFGASLLAAARLAGFSLVRFDVSTLRPMWPTGRFQR